MKSKHLFVINLYGFVLFEEMFLSEFSVSVTLFILILLYLHVYVYTLFKNSAERKYCPPYCLIGWAKRSSPSTGEERG